MNILDDSTYVKTLQEATALWGLKFQREMVIEECAELILSLRHLERGRIDLGAVLVEAADVLITVSQLVNDNGAAEFMTDAIDEKMERLARRVASNDSELK